MDINWLEDFACLARTLSFTRAAEERHVTQSALSRRIKALEIWAGTALIDRGGYPVKLSAAGEEFLPVAKEILIQLLRTRDDLRSRDRSGLKFYGFAAPHSISVNQLPSLLNRLARACPLVRTRVMSDDLHACCQLLSEGACEFLLCYRHGHIPLTLDEHRFDRRDLAIDRLVPVCAGAGADHGGEGGPAWRLPGSARARIPHLAYAKGSFLGAVVDHALKARRPFLDIRHMDAFAEALKGLALQGAGIAWLPESAARDALAAGRLHEAGGAEWHIELTLSIFAAPDLLDDTGRTIWNFFSNSAG